MTGCLVMVSTMDSTKVRTYDSAAGSESPIGGPVLACAASCSASSAQWSPANSTSCLSPKYRKKVLRPTSARSAMSLMGAGRLGAFAGHLPGGPGHGRRATSVGHGGHRAERETRRRAQQFLHHLEHKGTEAIAATLHPEITFTHPLSLSGKREVAVRCQGTDRVLGYLGGAFTMMDRIRFTNQRISVAAGGGTAFVQADGDLTTSDGRPYQNVYIFRIDWRGDRIIAVEEYANPLTFCQTFNNPLCAGRPASGDAASTVAILRREVTGWGPLEPARGPDDHAAQRPMTDGVSTQSSALRSTTVRRLELRVWAGEYQTLVAVVEPPHDVRWRSVLMAELRDHADPPRVANVCSLKDEPITEVSLHRHHSLGSLVPTVEHAPAITTAQTVLLTGRCHQPHEHARPRHVQRARSSATYAESASRMSARRTPSLLTKWLSCSRSTTGGRMLATILTRSAHADPCESTDATGGVPWVWKVSMVFIPQA